MDTAFDDLPSFTPQPMAPPPPEPSKKAPNTTTDLQLIPTQPLENIHAALTIWLSATGRDLQGFSCRLVEENGQFTSLVVEFPPHSTQQHQQLVVDFLKQSQLVQEKDKAADYAVGNDDAAE